MTAKKPARLHGNEGWAIVSRFRDGSEWLHRDTVRGLRRDAWEAYFRGAYLAARMVLRKNARAVKVRVVPR